MSLVIELRPELEAELASRAAVAGLSPAQYAGRLVEEQIGVPAPSALSRAERVALWLAVGRDLPPTPVLSDEAMSRDSIYDERG